MPLPEYIEIVPVLAPVTATITIPGSKSITNRALILAALSSGKTILQGALWSEDTQVMVECLRQLSFSIEVEADANDSSNRTVTVQGLGGAIPSSGSRPVDLFVGNAGTAARFLSAFVCLGGGIYRLRGVKRMHERPQASLFQALRQLGYRLDSPNDRLPVVIHGGRARPGACQVSIEESSQFASALSLCAKAGGWQVQVTGENAEESPYVAMTLRLIEKFPLAGGRFQIEPDASSGSYFWAADWILNRNYRASAPKAKQTVDGANVSKRAEMQIAHWPDSNWQIDARFPGFLPLPPSISREGQLGDSIMTAVVLAAALLPSEAKRPHTEFRQLGRLRLQECDRVEALHVELSRCGAKITEKEDSLLVEPSGDRLHGAEIETYDDHRMAMCFAILGLKVPGIKIKNPACVKKTFPNFFQKLALPPPSGLGVVILDAHNDRKLMVQDLFAV